MCKTSHNRIQTSARFGHEGTRKPAKRCLHNLVENPGALGFHQETTEESRKQQDWFCIKLYIIFEPN